MQTRIFKDRVMAYKKGDGYLAVSLEFDLLAQGKTILEALERLLESTYGYLKVCCLDKEPDSKVYRKAPKKYQNLYELFVDLDNKKRKTEEQKKREEILMRQEPQTAQFTYTDRTFCHA